MRQLNGVYTQLVHRTHRRDGQHFASILTELLGMVDERLLFIAYTLRNDVIRIISARGAEPNERRRYDEGNV